MKQIIAWGGQDRADVYRGWSATDFVPKEIDDRTTCVVAVVFAKDDGAGGI